MLRILLFINLTVASLFLVGPQSIKGIRTINAVVAEHNQRTTPQSYAGRQLMVGQGGGFTGASTTYCLLDNGQLFVQRDLDTTYTLVGKRPLGQTQKLFRRVEEQCKIKSTRFNQPGNLYQFVQWRRGAQTYRVAWDTADKGVPAAYPTFYRSFMALLPKKA